MEEETNLNSETICEVKFNKLSGDYIVFYPNAINNPRVFTSSKKANSYCDKVNTAFKEGRLKIVDQEIIKVELI